MPSDPAVVDQAVAPRHRARRMAEGLGFVVIWMALGFLLPGSAETYLLLGIPLTVLFQLLVRRRPLRELWVRDTATFVLGRRGVVIAAVLLPAPVYYGTLELSNGNWDVVGWYAAAAAGAIPAGFAVRSSPVAAALRSSALPVAIGVLGNVVVYGVLHLTAGTAVDLPAALATAVRSLALYFPLTFVIEEVAFRGALDAHVHHLGEDHGAITAVFVSLLWGLWHLPVTQSGLPVPLLVLLLLSWHCAVGVPLSLSWRRSGNLAGPGFAHATMDAVRNGMLVGL